MVWPPHREGCHVDPSPRYPHHGSWEPLTFVTRVDQAERWPGGSGRHVLRPRGGCRVGVGATPAILVPERGAGRCGAAAAPTRPRPGRRVTNVRGTLDRATAGCSRICPVWLVI